MIDLRNTCILVRTKEENEMLLKEAEKQGFHWYLKDDCKPLLEQHFPDILRFCKKNKAIVYGVRIWSDYAFYEASELLGTKEVAAREFIECIIALDNCNGRSCSECALNRKNTKCNKTLCLIDTWEGNVDELLEIAKSGKSTVPTPEEKAIEDLKSSLRIQIAQR